MTTAKLQKRPSATAQKAATGGNPEYEAPVAHLVPREPALTQDQLLDLLDFTAAKHLGSL